jgi:hypothetical protein
LCNRLANFMTQKLKRGTEQVAYTECALSPNLNYLSNSNIYPFCRTHLAANVQKCVTELSQSYK